MQKSPETSVGDITIRTERAGDEDAIRAVHESAFPGPTEAGLVEALRAHRRLTISLVAEVGGQVVGHVAFSPVSAPGARGALGLAPLAVQPAWQGRGIGAALVRRGLARGREAACPFVVVFGAPAYYGRFGFAPARSRGLYDEYGGEEEFQVIELLPGGIPRGGGLVRYAEEFALVSAPSPDIP